MALTKKDLRDISELFNYGFRSFVIPYIDEKMSKFNMKLNEHIASLHSKIDDNTQLIGYYFEQCAMKEEHQLIKKRVEKLEAKCGV